MSTVGGGYGNIDWNILLLFLRSQYGRCVCEQVSTVVVINPRITVRSLRCAITVGGGTVVLIQFELLKVSTVGWGGGNIID